MAIYLGLDASTQSLSAVLLEVDGSASQVIFEHTFTYDSALPHYETTHGVLRSADVRIVGSPPLMWAEALDHMIAALAQSRPREMARLTAVAGSAQQHGSVYLTARGAARLERLEAGMPLARQLADGFSRAVSPVWMDSSTTEECGEIARAVGGERALAARTGSRAFERFTGPQIRRFFKREPDAYAQTSRIHLVSSFLASLLAGQNAPVDPGDGAGMNLMDLATSAWWPSAVDATAPDLAGKLPAITASSTVIATLAPYWQQRYALPAAAVVVWSGDNPCSLIGTGLVHHGRVAVSLGTSDTIFGPMPSPTPDESLSASVFGSPAGAFMGITVFKNGSLARERVRDSFGLDWSGFSAALRATPAGNDDGLLLPWFEPEITPDIQTPHVWRENLPDTDGPRNMRGVVEAQMMAMANHSQWMGVPISAIHATGGASANREVLHVMADVFGATVYQLETRNSACLGAALRAWHAHRAASHDPIGWPEVVRGVAEPDQATRMDPNPRHVARYAALRRRYAAFEQRHVTGHRAGDR